MTTRDKVSRERPAPGWGRAAMLAGGLLLGGLGALLLAGGAGRCRAKRNGAPRPAADRARYSHMPLDSEVHSPDFADAAVALPDATPMGHETHPAR